MRNGSPDPTPRRRVSSLRPTRQRTAIADALRDAGAFQTAQEIHDELKKRGGRVGLSTVYRTLQAWTESGEVDALRADGGETLYRRCFMDDHHHHLVCRRCGISVEVESPEVESWANAVAHKHAFADVTHTLEVYGLCKSCRL